MDCRSAARNGSPEATLKQHLMNDAALLEEKMNVLVSNCSLEMMKP